MQLAVPRRLLPRDVGDEAGRLVLARGLRGFADGMVSVLLAAYLTDLGFSAGQVGVLITGTLVGSAALTLSVGILGQSLNARSVLLFTSGLMLATGIGFAGVTEYWPLVLIAIAGTLNPSNGDVSLFLPTEQAVLSGAATGQTRTALFARYNLAGIFCGALGALCAGAPVALAKSQGWDLVDAERSGFVVYALVAVMVAVIYRGLPQPAPLPRLKTAPLAKSRAVVLRLTALFSIDSFAGGFVVQSLLVLWLFKRFDLSVETAGTIFFVAGLLSACSQLASAWLSARIGLIRTMVYTHLPSNAFLILAALMPNAELAVAFLLLRTSMSQMDVPARQSYVMSVVPPEERAAAASVTNVPRALASALSPALTGLLLSKTTFGWPLILCGSLKIIYDLLLLAQFQSRRPEEEVAAGRTTP
ncbi:MAG TPA: MFS transporter [Dehalococcoidia bacterium]|nr:MFS transporter [Dehalococcoidia bacterium]